MIERDIEINIDFLNNSEKYSTHNNFDKLYEQLKTLQGYREVIKHLPTVEAKPVVHCKDCNMLQDCKIAQYLGLEGYCSRGEKHD